MSKEVGLSRAGSLEDLVVDWVAVAIQNKHQPNLGSDHLPGQAFKAAVSGEDTVAVVAGSVVAFNVIVAHMGAEAVLATKVVAASAAETTKMVHRLQMLQAARVEEVPMAVVSPMAAMTIEGAVGTAVDMAVAEILVV